MYIYELPFEINRELCRLLDMDDTWKELAGDQMKYSSFDIIEIEQDAKRKVNSPTHQLFTRWGQLNHKVAELFILLYHMKHVPALRCLKPVVEERFHQLLTKLDNKNGMRNLSNDENGNIKVPAKPASGYSAMIPVPIMLLPTKFQSGQTANARNGNSTSQSEASSTDDSRSSARKAAKSEDEIAMNAHSLSKFSYETLTEATNNWSKENLIGSGGFGYVYKGSLICLPVAIKKLKGTDKRNQELIREMCLNAYRHDNILPLYGYSIEGPEACLIYQLMTGGSLQQRIHRAKERYPPLTWPQRYRIAVGVANGLVYLHNKDSKTPLIHGDIKPANILLDQCLMPKIGDFGLSRIMLYEDDKTHVRVSRPMGTLYYLPKEYCDAQVLSRELDTYSYGVVMLEMATARLPARKKNGSSDQIIFLVKDIIKMVENGEDIATSEDPDIINTPLSNPALCRELMRIGLNCANIRRQERPPMIDVYRQLNAIDFPEKNYQ